MLFIEIPQLMAFSKKWEVMVRLEWTPEANEVVWAGTGSWTPVGGWRHLLPVTQPVLLLPLPLAQTAWLPLPRFHLRLHQTCVSFLLLL